MTLQAYEHCTAWRTAIHLVQHLYVLTERFPDGEKSGLTATLRRGVAAASAKLAEAAQHDDTTAARSLDAVADSLVELDAHLLIAYQLGYISRWRTGRARRRLRGFQRELRHLADASRGRAAAGSDALPPPRLAA